MFLVGVCFSIVVFEALTDNEKRQNKSYVLRDGRITKGQARALEAGWGTYGLNSAKGKLDFEATFRRSAPTVLEIGFGMGDSLAIQAAVNPEKNFIGVEVHKPGVGRLLMKALENDLSNLRVYNEDIREVLNQSIPSKSIQAVQIFFPDPWPKKRHHKRRLLEPTFLDLVASKLISGGIVHIATDWVPYADVVERLFSTRSDFQIAETPLRPETKFERRSRHGGHDVRDIVYRLE